jgi:hypothetical protein
MPNPLAEIQSAIQKAPSSDGPANTIDTIVSTNSKKLQVPLGIETEDIISEDIISETLVTNNITTEYGNSFFGKRQSIIAGKTSSKNYSNFLEFESHNSKNVIVKASPDDPLIVSISNGYNEYGIPSNIIKRYDSDIIFDLTGYENKRCFLGLEVDAQGIK